MPVNGFTAGQPLHLSYFRKLPLLLVSSSTTLVGLESAAEPRRPPIGARHFAALAPKSHLKLALAVQCPPVRHVDQGRPRRRSRASRARGATIRGQQALWLAVILPGGLRPRGQPAAGDRALGKFRTYGVQERLMHVEVLEN